MDDGMVLESNADYYRFLKEAGLTEKQLRDISRNMSDHVDFDREYDVRRGPSRIHGDGLFAARNFHAWETICPARVGDRRTLAGRGMNHSVAPNVVMIRRGDDILAVARYAISEGEELTVNYRQTMRLALDMSKRGKR